MKSVILISRILGLVLALGALPFSLLRSAQESHRSVSLARLAAYRGAIYAVAGKENGCYILVPVGGGTIQIVPAKAIRRAA